MFLDLLTWRWLALFKVVSFYAIFFMFAGEDCHYLTCACPTHFVYLSGAHPYQNHSASL